MGSGWAVLGGFAKMLSSLNEKRYGERKEWSNLGMDIDKEEREREREREREMNNKEESKKEIN